MTKQLEKTEDGGKALIKELIGQDSTRGFDLDSVYCINGNYFVLELLFCDVSRNPWPRDSHPSRYFEKDKLKFLNLWRITNRLQGRLILINYEETHSEFKLMEVEYCDETGIKTKDDCVINKKGMMTWFQSLNHHHYMEIPKLNKGTYRIKCPECGLPLVLRESKDGRFKSFWGCSGYPKCRLIIRVQ